MNRSSHLEVFLRKCVLKICSKFTGEHSCQSVISLKLQSNFIEIALQHGCSLVNLLYISRTLFLKNTSGRLLLNEPLINEFQFWLTKICARFLWNACMPLLPYCPYCLYTKDITVILDISFTILRKVSFYQLAGKNRVYLYSVDTIFLTSEVFERPGFWSNTGAVPK